MDRIVVHRSGPLAGEVDVPGAKNSVLKLMVASLYAEGTHELTNVPAISDVDTMGSLLGALGVDVSHDLHRTDVLLLTNRGDVKSIAPSELVETIRASINLLGPLLACKGHVRL
ncbi:MAG: UDP-N-acetylglucosamine 1-carboxyvinyltransferase, partial [Actinomycetes bacterium]